MVYIFYGVLVIAVLLWCGLVWWAVALMKKGM